jgi:hypothetical protein
MEILEQDLTSDNYISITVVIQIQKYSFNLEYLIQTIY